MSRFPADAPPLFRAHPAAASLLALVLLLLHAASPAEFYTWTDEHGVKQFSDKPPRNGHTGVQTIEVPQIDTIQTRVIPADALPRPSRKATGRSGKQAVLMYSAPWCGVCKRAKSYFRQRSIPFREKDIDASAQARQEFQRLGGRGVPLILVGKQRLSGFSPASFEQLYAGSRGRR